VTDTACYGEQYARPGALCLIEDNIEPTGNASASIAMLDSAYSRFFSFDVLAAVRPLLLSP